MTPDQVTQRLREHEVELRERFGVRRLALFGSTLRGDADPDSDVDLLVDFDARPVGLFDLFRLEDRLSELLDGASVDLVLRRAVIPELRKDILGSAVDVVPEPADALS